MSQLLRKLPQGRYSDMMTQEEKKKLGIFLTALSEYYQREISIPVLKMYVEDLEDLNYDAVIWAYNSLRRDSGAKSMPLPTQIRERVLKGESGKSKSVDAASRIIGAVAKFGLYNPSEARKYIGDLGWLAVERSGGWSSLCEMTTDQIGVWRAQLERLCEALIDKSNAGTLHDAPSFDRIEHKTSPEMVSIGELLKGLPGASDETQ